MARRQRHLDLNRNRFRRRGAPPATCYNAWIDHAALQDDRVVLAADALEISERRMTRAAASGAVEVRLSGSGISDDDARGIHCRATASLRRPHREESGQVRELRFR